ncbi:12061_t:CDS:2, partial [Gigaspora rosea]
SMLEARAKSYRALAKQICACQMFEKENPGNQVECACSARD